MVTKLHTNLQDRAQTEKPIISDDEIYQCPCPLCSSQDEKTEN